MGSEMCIRDRFGGAFGSPVLDRSCPVHDLLVGEIELILELEHKVPAGETLSAAESRYVRVGGPDPLGDCSIAECHGGESIGGLPRRQQVPHWSMLRICYMLTRGG